MSKTITLAEADRLVDTNDRYFWETYAKTLVFYTPGRGATFFRKDGFFNRNWSRGRGRWGTAKRIEVGSDGLYRL